VFVKKTYLQPFVELRAATAADDSRKETMRPPKRLKKSR